MFNQLGAIVLFAVLLVGPGWLLAWELTHRRTIPPFRIERANRPLWYWSCIVAHSLLLALLALVYVFAFLVLIIIPDISN